MNAPRNAVLSLLLPDTGDGSTDLRTFRGIWSSLQQTNRHLLGEVRAILCLSLAPCILKEAVTSEIEATGVADGIPIHHICDSSWGRCLNDAFIFAVSCDRAKYWLHVDGEHVCSRPFWNSAVAVLRGPGAYLWQLQITDDWDDLPEERLLERDGFTEVVPHPDAAGRDALDPDDYVDDEPFLSRWPVFSLRPGVFLLDHFRRATACGLSLRPFHEDSAWAPLQWRFGAKLEELGARKGVLTPAAFSYADSEEMDEDSCYGE
jgi:hypothetical protein